ncbi:Ig-like domain-containing protein [Serratia rhizosphaerae]|uniref:Big-1 domain-containing protein n=1 Tax=Serratia rhizosphaerae TaxID=2597702 RepID=A0ABX6GP36_9GAMM|nr:Ig-like domain-containing protein [Serratia rhizosphaerae]QHA88012.1 hypothetical protein FO014_14175 [Serratia rhizosphaerae]
MSNSNSPNATINSLEVTHNRALADGVDRNTVLVQICDDNADPLPDQVVIFKVSTGANIQSPVITDAQGLALAALTSTTSGGCTVRASVTPYESMSTGVFFVETSRETI